LSPRKSNLSSCGAHIFPLFFASFGIDKQKLLSGVAKFRIDVDIHNLLMHSSPEPVKLPTPWGMTLPNPLSRSIEKTIRSKSPDSSGKSRLDPAACYRRMRGWLFPYIRSRVSPGDFHPITAYLFVEYNCNLDCWYRWAYNNKVKGMTEDIARRSIDWLYDHG
jgi:hypothetical protein